MTLHTSRGLPSFRDSPGKRHRATAKPCAWPVRSRIGRLVSEENADVP